MIKDNMLAFKDFFEGVRPVVTMDFDHNLKFEIGKPNLKTIEKYKELQNDYDVIIITTRIDSKKSREEIIDFLKTHGLLFKDIIHTNGELKLKEILKVGSRIHFDDDELEIEKIKKYNEENGTNIKTEYTFDEKAWKEYEENDYEEE
jgi:hypothetical protein